MPNIATSCPANPRYAAGAVTAFVGLSAANVLPPLAQAALYAVGLVAVFQSRFRIPLPMTVALLVAGGYVVASRLALGIELDGALRLWRPCVEGYLLAHVLHTWCRIRNFRSAALVLGGAIAIQFVVAASMAMFPAARLAAIEGIYADESYANAQFTAALIFRGYGISRHHLYGFALACGLSAALLLVAATMERAGVRRTVLASLAVAGLLLVAVNARIGFVPLVVCYLAGATFLFHRFYPKHLLAVAVLLLAPLVVLGSIYFGDDFDTVWSWLGAGVMQFGESDPSESNTLSDLRAMLVFSSDTLERVVGAGRACGVDEACYSDIGFVRALQEGGVVYLLLVLGLYWQLNQHIVRLFRRSVGVQGPARRRAATLLAVVVHATFVAAMIKGEAFGANDYSRLVATLGCLGTIGSPRRRQRPATAAVQTAGRGGSAAALSPPSPSEPAFAKR